MSRSVKMKYRRLIIIILALCILLSSVSFSAAAADLSASNRLIEFIKANETFSQYVQWDYQHYAVGYGTRCESWEYPNGITKQEAEVLLRDCVRMAEDAVNSFIKKNSLHPTQEQYDTLVSITYGLGTEWMRSCYELPKIIVNGCTELELLNTLGGWVTANGDTLNGLIYRRMRETYIYMQGIYTAENDLPYACIKFDPCGGNVDYKRVYTYMGSPYGMELQLPVPTKNGYVFTGWFDSKGNRITDSTIAKETIMTVTARWAESQTIFTDVKNSDWFYEDVKQATELGLFTGYKDGSFQPKTQINRAMFAQVLYRIAGEPVIESDIPFADVKGSDWFYDAVCWAYQSGIVNGVSSTQFSPYSLITREQMATMLFKLNKYYGVKGCSVSATMPPFEDLETVSSYAVEPMRWAVESGLINGISSTVLAPKQYATRAQAATILVRLKSMLSSNIG